MTITASPTSSPPTARRSTPSASAATPASPSIARGATARSAASPRAAPSLNSPLARRASSKATSASSIANTETREFLSASLKQETDQKEQLLLQLQTKDNSISVLTAENDTLTSALNAAETRLNELYADQSRSESDLAQRIDITDKLRVQVRELEKEKRDLQRRYNEQTTTFEAERQAFYDNEQHLKSRIQSLTQARKRIEAVPAQYEVLSDEEEEELPEPLRITKPTEEPDLNDPESEPAEMTALKLELSTLSTSYSSLQSTLVLLQTQLVDLRRVNHELQEENESYMILLREKTLSGQFDLMRQVGGGSVSSDEASLDDGVENTDNGDIGSLHSVGRSILDRVDEEAGESLAFLQEDIEHNSNPDLESSRPSRYPSRQGRKRTLSNGASRGESLADLPITGPGLDLAAELGRAENKDILAGNAVDDRDRSVLNTKKRNAKTSDDRKGVLPESAADPTSSASDLDALRTEVKSLKDANKALSLYASKIIDRIIAQEGFEHVLAVDYEKEPSTPSTAHPNSTTSKSIPVAHTKARPQSVLVSRSDSMSSSDPRPAATPISKPTGSTTKTQRRSLSFDWKTFSLFNPAEKRPESNLRPLTLKPGASPVTGARKLDTQEDDEDRKERERLNATMKLMGIQPAPHSPLPIPDIQKSHSSDATHTVASNRRFSLFGSSRNTPQGSDISSIHSSTSVNGTSPPSLTQEALEHAEAENTLAALDAHERNLSAELAKGNGSGFTEIAPRVRRNKRSIGGSGSGSTVWSAGMSGDGDEL
ncbi:hypothetical protein BDQ12DRAFT_646758 [Crucibulum laeve]|uniref:M protein, serotype 2.1 n=1 Tax=Crucibulum laeve TaxID=68775 RepID=A0A5C3MB76_9AGAR|nr:hypothetical protein BDQ12DRAFT_646758 [Crucibulum laeve]